MRTRSAVVLSFLATALLGCAPAPVAPPTPAAASPAPASPIASPGTLARDRLPIAYLPPREEAVFGPVEALRQTDNQVSMAYRIGDDPLIQRFGLAGNRFLTLGGHEYAIHWDSGETFGALAVGQTVNLHPSDMVVCVETGAQFPQCYRLMRAYRGDRRIPPIQTR